MLRMQSKLYVVIAITIALTSVQCMPKCAPDDEDCRDRNMHPNLPSDGIGRKVDGEDTSAYWLNHGKEFIQTKLSAKPNTNRAKNVIMFLGDGMGLTTITAARNVIGGEEKGLAFENFPYTGFSKTYAVDKIVPDSACTATAYLTGVKGNEGTIGVNGNVERENCVTVKDTKNHVFSIAKWALDAGKSAGVVTTTRITHASPAGVYAHTADRDWENDNEVKKACGADSGVDDIAYQLIHGEVGSKLKVIMGGGRRNFVDTNGHRTDGRDLIEEYKQQNANNVYVDNVDALMSVDLTKAERLLGLFQDNHMLYHLETNETTRQPTLEEMTRKTIEYLSRNEKGYFVFIEGGRIDLAHHDNLARIALDETAEFSKAIKAARELTSEEDTLIVVTADHSHSFSFSGYPYRGNDIFGRAPATGDDSQPYLTLSYANGPGFEKFYDVEKHERRNPLEQITGHYNDVFPATVPRDLDTHSGDDVGVFASGPWAHLFSGTYEQNAIPHMMAYASCLGDGLKACDT